MRLSQVFGAAEAGFLEEDRYLLGADQAGAEPAGGGEAVGGDVVVVAVEAAAGGAEQLGEGVQLGEGDVADQVRPEPAVGGPSRAGRRRSRLHASVRM